MHTRKLLLGILLIPLFGVTSQCFGQAKIIMPPGVVNKDYGENIPEVLKKKYGVAPETSSANPMFEWRAVGPLPAGLGLQSSSGIVFGTPVAAKTYLFRVQVSDRSLPKPAPLTLLVSLQVKSDAEAPVLKPIEPPELPKPTPTVAPTPTAQTDSEEDVEIPSVVPRKNFTLPIKIKNDSIRQLKVVALNLKTNKAVDAVTKPDLPRGEVLTSVTLQLEEGDYTVVVSNVANNQPLRTFNMTVRPTDVDKPAEVTLALKHSGFVSEKDEKASVTVTVGPKVSKISVAAFEKADDGTFTKALEDVKAPTLTRETADYPVTVPLSKGDLTKIVVKDLTAGSKDEKSIEIKKDKALNAKAAADDSKKIVIEKPDKDFIVNDTAVDVFVKIPKDSKISKIQYEVKNGDKSTTSSEITVDTTKDDKKRVRVPILAGKSTIRFLNAADPGNLEQQATVDINCNENCAASFERAQFAGSQNSRAIVGLEQAGASSASTETKPFVDFFFSTPILFSRCKKGPNGVEDEAYFECIARRRTWLAVWGDVRLTTTPDQVAAVGVLPSNFVNQLGKSSNTVDLVQSFDFLMGLEGRLYTANGSFLSLIPGIKQRTHFYAAGGGGAINPLTARRELAQIFKIPKAGSPQREDFLDRYGPIPDSDPAKEFVGFVPLDRDRFLRQWYAGLRLKTFYCENRGCSIYRNNFPAIVDVMIGQNEAVTGGSLFHLKPDPNDATKTIKKRSMVLRFDAFYPFPLREANFLYFYGTAIMKIGAGGVRIQNPLFLDTAPGDVLITDPKVFIPSSDLQKIFQPSRDYYKLGVGINLTELFNRGTKP